ncbi:MULTISPECIES: hypothetical protein [unclassified Streptomyces]|uniref:hypothetical protein n=1 Tax=unclassified Streptomyces TaxID=2593676 RepID=UPI002E2A8B50|nr:hypothetical protein [Streptomyces sp. NBC_00273]
MRGTARLARIGHIRGRLMHHRSRKTSIRQLSHYPATPERSLNVKYRELMQLTLLIAEVLMP